MFHVPFALQFCPLHPACIKLSEHTALLSFPGNYLSTYSDCIHNRLSRIIPVDFLIREYADFALDHLEHPLEDWCFFLFFIKVGDMQANRQTGQAASPHPHLLIPSSLLLLVLISAPRLVLCHWRGEDECEQKSKQLSIWTQLCAAIKVKEL